MCLLRRLFSPKLPFTKKKWALWGVLAIFSLPAYGASAEPLTVQNPFVSTEVLQRIEKIEISGQPVLVLNPYVAPLESFPNSPYRCITPTPQVVFPSQQK